MAEVAKHFAQEYKLLANPLDHTWKFASHPDFSGICRAENQVKTPAYSKEPESFFGWPTTLFVHPEARPGNNVGF
eukprot:scaffold2287_cov151-Cylindrotheca_fusiformis.AAC.6